MTRTAHFVCAFFLFCLALSSAGCISDDTAKPANGNPLTIGAEGGRIETTDGLILEIPAGALAKETTFAIFHIDPPNGENLTAVSSFYRIEPKETTLAREANLLLPYDASAIVENQTVSDIFIFHSPTGEAWSPISTAKLEEQTLVTAKITALGRFGAAVEAEEIITDGDFDAEALPALVVADLFSFGLIAIGESAEETLTLKNGGDAPLKISALQFSDSSGAFTLSDAPNEAILTPDETLSFQAAYEPTNQSAHTATLVIESNDPTAPEFSVTLEGRGGGAGESEITPEDIRFEAINVGQTATQTLTISNISEAGKLIVYKLYVGESAFSLSGLATPASLGAGESKTLTITFSPQNSGYHQETLIVKTDDMNRSEWEIDLSGEALGEEDEPED